MGKQSQGGQEKRYKDNLKASLKDSEYREQIALDRARWCCLIRRGKNDYEAKRICEAEIKHKERRDPHQSSRN